MRIIDANLNRALEGLRVCEEVMRFMVSRKEGVLRFKNFRHSITRLVKDWGIAKNSLLGARDSRKDIGKFSVGGELFRADYKDIFYANLQRTKESIRVLEEFSKLYNKKISAGFKKMRYSLYQIEKETNSRL